MVHVTKNSVYMGVFLCVCMHPHVINMEEEKRLIGSHNDHINRPYRLTLDPENTLRSIGHTLSFFPSSHGLLSLRILAFFVLTAACRKEVKHNSNLGLGMPLSLPSQNCLFLFTQTFFASLLCFVELRENVPNKVACGSPHH